jgi:hypothetical protein
MPCSSAASAPAARVSDERPALALRSSRARSLCSPRALRRSDVRATPHSHPFRTTIRRSTKWVRLAGVLCGYECTQG